MKRFLIGTLVCFFLIAGGVWQFFYRGFYLDLNPDAPMEVPFRTYGKEIQILGADGRYHTTRLKGVDMLSSIPGEHASDYMPTEKDYLRWFGNVGDMGANVIRVYTLMDSDFYNALYTYNTTGDEPLYLLQGIELSEKANNSHFTAFDQRFRGALIEDGKYAVDIIHGRKITNPGSSGGGGNYFKDVSSWVLGYIVGYEWNADTIAYTDNSDYQAPEYQGAYLATSEDASKFEVMLAEVMDSILEYESSKYKTQRLIGFNSDPSIDFLEYDETYARQLNKYATLDPEHILPQEKLQSGYFAAYRLFDFCNSFADYLSEAQTAQLSPYLESIDRENAYGGYLDLVGAYHTMPVIASGYGFSSARGAVAIGEPPLTEAQQGENLMRVWQDAMDAGWAGVTISTWQDVWEHRTWNTAFATELSQSYLWHDLQTEGQNYGLLSFEPGEELVCVTDGNDEEWQNDSPVLETEGLALYVRHDQRGIYLLIRGDTVSANTQLYLPLDINPDLGSNRCDSPALTFSQNADFLLCIDGTANTRLLVQERQDALRENFNREMGKDDPFISWLDKDSTRFVSIGMALKNDTLLDDSKYLTAEEIQKLRALGVWETGALRHGNGDPESPDYDSLADFCFGNHFVEIRIPWLLLNVANPSEMHIHDDYYKNYGVEFRSVKQIYLGLGTGEQEIALTAVDTKNWNRKLTWHERLKQSYYVVQNHWKE